MAENLQNFIEQLWPPGSVAHPVVSLAEVAHLTLVRRESFLCVRVALAAKVAATANLGTMPFLAFEARESLMHVEAQGVRRATGHPQCAEFAVR
jgi:hypothetical protein